MPRLFSKIAAMISISTIQVYILDYNTNVIQTNTCVEFLVRNDHLFLILLITVQIITWQS